jgi:hypothetical protein
LIKDIEATPSKQTYRGGNPLVIAEIRKFIASCGGKEWMHKMMDTKLHAAVFIGFCAEFMVNHGQANEIMKKACELIDKQFPNQPSSLKTLIEHGIIHFTEDDAEFRKMIFESDLYLAFIEVVRDGDYVEELSFYWSDATYALYGKY